jgi:1,2-phenylacetyl-CoA epoxidase catalytic subunit
MEERGWQQRDTRAMACLDRPFTAWTEYVAANVLVDTAMTTLLGAAVESTYEPLRQRARKILQEEAAHWVHGSGWLRRLSSQPAMQPTLERMWDDAFTWFGPAGDPLVLTLVRARILDADPDALRARLQHRLDESGLRLDRRLPWERWDPAARRLSS